MAVLRLFGPARDAAGGGRFEIEGADVGAVLEVARRRFGGAFCDVLAGSRIWVNGEGAPAERPVGPGDEVAVLPPVSGGI